jgi:hypothetical protein
MGTKSLELAQLLAIRIEAVLIVVQHVNKGIQTRQNTKLEAIFLNILVMVV